MCCEHCYKKISLVATTTKMKALLVTLNLGSQAQKKSTSQDNKRIAIMTKEILLSTFKDMSKISELAVDCRES